METSHEGFTKPHTHSSPTQSNRTYDSGYGSLSNEPTFLRKLPHGPSYDVRSEVGDQLIHYGLSNGRKPYYDRSECRPRSRSLDGSLRKLRSVSKSVSRFVSKAVAKAVSNSVSKSVFRSKDVGIDGVNQVGGIRSCISILPTKSDNFDRCTNRVSRPRNQLQMTNALQIEASATHLHEILIMEAVTESVRGAIRPKIARLHYQRMSLG